MTNPDKEGKFGEFGGRYIAETLMPEVSKLGLYQHSTVKAPVPKVKSLLAGV